MIDARSIPMTGDRAYRPGVSASRPAMRPLLPLRLVVPIWCMMRRGVPKAGWQVLRPLRSARRTYGRLRRPVRYQPDRRAKARGSSKSVSCRLAPLKNDEHIHRRRWCQMMPLSPDLLSPRRWTRERLRHHCCAEPPGSGPRPGCAAAFRQRFPVPRALSASQTPRSIEISETAQRGPTRPTSSLTTPLI